MQKPGSSTDQCCHRVWKSKARLPVAEEIKNSQLFAGSVAHWWSFYILEALSSISSTENKNQNQKIQEDLGGVSRRGKHSQNTSL